jgi:hypothetical protein
MEYRRIATPPPTEQMMIETWYHGTQSTERFEGICREGLKAQAFHNWDFTLAPIPTQVYLTKIYNEALAYALVLYPSEQLIAMQSIIAKMNIFGNLCYVLQFDGNDLKDVYPDEDMFTEGRGLSQDTIDSANEYMRKKIPTWNTRNAKEKMLYFVKYYPKGKMRSEVLDKIRSIGHRGEIFPAAAYEINREAIWKKFNRNEYVELDAIMTPEFAREVPVK